MQISKIKMIIQNAKLLVGFRSGSWTSIAYPG